MILKLLLSAVICTAVYADILSANDAKTCEELCSSCQGTASIIDGYCECYVPDGNTKGDCVMRIKRQADELGLDLMDCEPASGDRPARCNLRSHMVRTNDVDRVARYFMRGGAIAGHPILGSPQCDTDNVVGAPNPQIQKQPETPRLEMMVGAPSPCQSSEPQLSSSPSYEAYYQMPDSIVGAPMLSTPYNNMPHLLYKPSRVAPFLQRSVVLPHLSAGAQLRLNPYYSRFHYPLLSHLRHPLLRAPYLGDSAVNIVGAVPENYASPDQMLAERPETLAAAPPIVQPGYVHSSTPRVEVPMSNDMTMFLHEILMHQNAILEAIQQRLHKAGENVGASRMLSASMEPNLGAPPPKPPNCHCPGQNKHQMPMVGAPRKPDCKQRAPRMSPAMETLVEGIDKIENIENNENIENIANMGNIEQQQLEKMAIVENEQMANNEAFKTEVTTEKPQKEARSIANGRKRKRELKKILESKAA